jgi:hypothetical protein
MPSTEAPITGCLYRRVLRLLLKKVANNLFHLSVRLETASLKCLLQRCGSHGVETRTVHGILLYLPTTVLCCSLPEGTRYRANVCASPSLLLLRHTRCRIQHRWWIFSGWQPPAPVSWIRACWSNIPQIMDDILQCSYNYAHFCLGGLRLNRRTRARIAGLLAEI